MQTSSRRVSPSIFNSLTTRTTTKASKNIPIIYSTTCGKYMETLFSTYKVVTEPTLENASTIWSPIVSTTNIAKLQNLQNTALRTITGCTHVTNIQHLHDTHSTLLQSIHHQTKETNWIQQLYTTHIKTQKKSQLHTSNKTWNAYTLLHSLHTWALRRLIRATTTSISTLEHH